MAFRLVSIALVVFSLTIYALDRGIFIGTAVRVTEIPFSIHKRCRYLFVTGAAEFDAANGEIPESILESDTERLTAAGFSSQEISSWILGLSSHDLQMKAREHRVDNGYCRLFAGT